MAIFLLLNDIQTINGNFTAGELLDDSIFDVNQLTAAGGLTLAFSAGMEPIRKRFVSLRTVDPTVAVSTLHDSLSVNQFIPQSPVPLSQHVIVENESDFPTAVAGVITLDPNIVYTVNGAVTITSRIVMPVTALVRGISASRDRLIYTGAGALITVESGPGLPTISGLNLTHINGLALDVNRPANFVLRQVTVTANEIAQIDVVGGIVMENCLFTGFSQGVTFEGTPDRLTSTVTAYIQDAAGTGACVDFGTAVFNSVLMAGLRCITQVNGTGVSGLADSANITSGNFGKINLSDINGPGTFLSGITNEDVRWDFNSVSGVENSIDLADILIAPGNTTVTAITQQGAADNDTGWVKLAGETTAVFQSRLTMTADNRIRYDGEVPKKLLVSVCLAVEMDTGGENDLQMGVALNSAINANTATPVSASAASPASITCNFVSTFNPGDFVEVFVRNLSSSTTGIVGNSLHFIVKAVA